MRLYKNLIEACNAILIDIFKENYYADKAIKYHLKQNKKWGSKDRKFIAETCYEIVRYKRLYSHIIDSLGLHTNTWYNHIALHLHFNKSIVDFPDWYGWHHIDWNAVDSMHASLVDNFAVSESYPDWLINWAKKELDEKLLYTELSAMNEQAKLCIRVNTLKTSREEMIALLAKQNIDAIPIENNDDALFLPTRSNVFQLDLFKQGLFEVQDAGSQLIAPYCQVDSRMRVIDACAGAGGKSLHLAALMENKGEIVAMDIYPNKLKELKRRAKRNGVHNIRIKESNATSIKRLRNSADVVLLDVPCSGIGVIRRNPDSKWKLHPERMEQILKEQTEIISTYANLVKKGGSLIYSTCSILPSENEQQIETFVAQNKDFALVDSRTVYPSEGYDGFFMARLQRQE